MKCLRFVFLYIISVSVVSCASGPKYSSVEAGFPELTDGNARIFFYMEPQVQGFAISMLGLGFGFSNIAVNDKNVGKAAPGTFFFVDIPPGKYRLSDRPSKYILQYDVPTKSINMANRETKFVEMFSSVLPVSSHRRLRINYIRFRIMDSRQARKNITSLKFRIWGQEPLGVTH